ncbi:MAG: 16S rRNA (guanine(527)-N(7))-methyltransferase RsmG [Deltaproteobacteria bacterium]|jgi:16S rRNA (guanine527-N7)-methyltransferase|nr:16S rRNA (guanine(527)-N(7))-methyltransferase RsmG [Deltaproteobacteria bacterium]
MSKERTAEIYDEFKKAGLDLSSDELTKFSQLDQLLLSKNKELDLTRIDSSSSIIRKHYIDSSILGEFIKDGSGIFMDLGSGAGFPGLPLAIRKPKLQLLLAEPRLKRLTFLDEVINLLNLDNVELYPHKVTENFDRPLDGIVTRDFLPLPETLSLCASILRAGNELYMMKGPNVEEELKNAKKLDCYKMFSQLKKYSYSIDGGKSKRWIIQLSKEDKTDNKKLIYYKRDMPKITEIASIANSRFKAFTSLTLGKNIKKTGECLVFGRKMVMELRLSLPEIVKGIIAKKLSDISDFKVPIEWEIILLRPEIFPLIDIFGTGPPILLVKTPEIKAVDLSSQSEAIRLFVPFQDPANVGSIIRTCGALGVSVVLLKEAGNPYHPKALRASGPLSFHTDITKGPALSELAAANVPNLYALSAKGEDIYSFEPPEKGLNLVIGIEGPGLDEFFPKEKRLMIPMRKSAESLNASVAAAMALAILGPKLKK